MIKDPISIIPLKVREKLQSPYQLCINGIPQFSEGKHLCGTIYKNPITISKLTLKELQKLQKSNEEFPFTIKKFEYNGFYGRTYNEIVSYKAKFRSWTGDPGIASMECSDGKVREIPTYAIIGSLLLPKDNTKKNILFGNASKS